MNRIAIAVLAVVVMAVGVSAGGMTFTLKKEKGGF
jgi:hypothetical protein